MTLMILVSTLVIQSVSAGAVMRCRHASSAEDHRGSTDVHATTAMSPHDQHHHAGSMTAGSRSAHDAAWIGCRCGCDCAMTCLAPTAFMLSTDAGLRIATRSSDHPVRTRTTTHPAFGDDPLRPPIG
jgi:hypothetical protein